jgi:hypothetical protein
LVQIAMVIAQAIKMMRAWAKWITFFVRPMPPEGRGSRMFVYFFWFWGRWEGSAQGEVWNE